MNVRRERALLRRAARELVELRTDIGQHAAEVDEFVEQVRALRAVADAVLAEARALRVAMTEARALRAAMA